MIEFWIAFACLGGVLALAAVVLFIASVIRHRDIIPSDVTMWIMGVGAAMAVVSGLMIVF